MKHFVARSLAIFIALVALLSPVSVTSHLVLSPQTALADSGCVKLSINVLSGGNGQVCPTANQSVLVVYVIQILQLVALSIGGIIVLMIVIAGIQYIISAGDPGAIKSAKNRITNAITALVVYLFMYAALNFLIPGGIFN
ncbi:hypothetical protein HJC99_01275 [Candidatus Saccharibacteria bacterium]|nr:hypothetical protein [Candidatus Saccharibacteria bacterium]